MHFNLLSGLAVLLMTTEIHALPYQDGWVMAHHGKPALRRRQQETPRNGTTLEPTTTPQNLPSSDTSETSSVPFTSILASSSTPNDTATSDAPISSTGLPTTSLAPTTQPPITSQPELSTSNTINPTTTVSTATTLTVSNGETATPDVGAVIFGGAAGGVILINGATFAVPQGALVSVVSLGGNGQAPEVTTLEDPGRTQDPEQSNDPGTTNEPGTTTQPQAPSTTTQAQDTTTTAGTETTSGEPTTVDTTASTAVTTSQAAEATPHIVLVSSNATEPEVEAIRTTLSGITDAQNLTEVTSERTGLVVFWRAPITLEQAETLRNATGVSNVSPDVSLEKPDETSALVATTGSPRSSTATGPAGSPATTIPNPQSIELQSDAVEELKAISQPQGASLDDLPGFGYASEAGSGVTVYVIDTGANPENPEWSGMPGTKEFIFPPGVPAVESDFLNHGSCVSSKATGPKFGAAKNANIVMLKLPTNLHMSAIFASLVEISNDVFQKGLEGKAVINMSLGSRIGDQVADTLNAYKLLLSSLILEDIVIVTASGNDAQYGINDVTEYPALFVQDMDIIVVGATDKFGYREFYSQGEGDQLTVSAPGNVDCASGRTNGDTELYGTSFAAPTVAGVIAVWLSQEEHKARLQVPGKVVANVKSMLQSLAYERVAGEPPVVWNGIDPRGLACAAPAANGRKRQESAPAGCQATSATAAITTRVATETAVSGTIATTLVVSTAVASTATAQPSPPPKPEWGNPQGWEKVFEADGVASHSYTATSDSATEGVDADFEKWCLDKCGDGCSSVYLYRELQLIRGQYNTYFICNRYDTVWSDEFQQTGFEGRVDSGVAFNKV